MNFSINRKRSEFMARYKDETLGRNKAFLTVLSTFSLPEMPMCPGTEMNVIGVLMNAKVVWRT